MEDKRVQTKPGYQEPERNQEVKNILKQKQKRNQDNQQLWINNWNRNQEWNQELQAEILGSTRNFLVRPVILAKTKN